MPYMRKTISYGDTIEVVEYHQAPTVGSNAKTGAYNDAVLTEQREKNLRRSIKDMARVIACNFSRERNDLFVTCTEADRMDDWMEPVAVDKPTALRHRKAFLEKLRREREKRGLPPLKWMGSTEKQGRWHHHLILNAGFTLEELQGMWPHGRIMVTILDDAEQYRNLASYLLRDTKGALRAGKPKEPRQRGERGWSGSRNLLRPVEKVEVIKRESVMRRMPREKKGYQLLPGWVVRCDEYGFLYRAYAYRRVRPTTKKKMRGRGRGGGDRPSRG